jgi:light-harvesting protein B-800-850 alpha chain
MNQGRIWCVVNPTIGLPLFLGSVALMSFTVHFAVINNSSWMKDFYNGTGMVKTASTVEETAMPTADVAKAETPALAVEVAQAPVVEGEQSTSFILKIKPKDPALDPS